MPQLMSWGENLYHWMMWPEKSGCHLLKLAVPFCLFCCARPQAAAECIVLWDGRNKSGDGAGRTEQRKPGTAKTGNESRGKPRRKGRRYKEDKKLCCASLNSWVCCIGRQSGAGVQNSESPDCANCAGERKWTLQWRGWEATGAQVHCTQYRTPAARHTPNIDPYLFANFGPSVVSKLEILSLCYRLQFLKDIHSS